MARKVIRFVLIIAALSSVSAMASEGWARLRLGMTATETVAAIGYPLMRTAGKNFEVWTYDNRAEVVFYGGPLVGWTSPASARAPARAVDVWQDAGSNADGPMFVLPPAPKQPPSIRWEWREYGTSPYRNRR